MPRESKSIDPPPSVFYEVTDGILIIRFRSANFSLPEAIEVRDIIYGKLQGVTKNVILNLNGVNYIDSTAISLVVRISNEMGLRIANVSEPVALTLKQMRIFDLLYILSSEFEARRSLFEP
ncbi:MAG: STAS domain-containing protein [Planctomycetota bacterium]